jgi:predicted PhzF superfamily epimerase YddE/YHI9
VTRGIDVLRYAAFTDNPTGGNPAGVVLDATGLDAPTMQAIAAEVGYSETAFLTPSGDGGREFDVRYFAPSIEVPFCGHATIATGVALGERLGVGRFVLYTHAGTVPVDVTALLDALRWSAADLDTALPPKVAFAGAWHPVVAAATRARLADLDYDFPALRDLMTDRAWTTIQLVWRESPTVFHVRNPFAVGGVVEDPATGAAAAALGHYLRAAGLIATPATLTLHQGVDLGRPSLLVVDVDEVDPRIRVGGQAVPIPAAT